MASLSPSPSLSVPTQGCSCYGWQVAFCSLLPITIAATFALCSLCCYLRKLSRPAAGVHAGSLSGRATAAVAPHSGAGQTSATSHGNARNSDTTAVVEIDRWLPVFVYSAMAHEGGLECALCLNQFGDGEEGRLLPRCYHSFHRACIDVWLRSHSTCPLCRSVVEAEVLE